MRDGHVWFEPSRAPKPSGKAGSSPAWLTCTATSASTPAAPSRTTRPNGRRSPTVMRACCCCATRDRPAADTRWVDDRDDLPRIVRAGRLHRATKRYIRNYGVEIEPDELVAQVEVEARHGDGWVKLVGDWIDRDTGDLGPCWPRSALDAAIALAHQLGARVAAYLSSARTRYRT